MKKYKEFEYLKESNKESEFNVGDVVLVLPRLKYYIENNNWPKIMYDLIGKEVTIVENDDDGYFASTHDERYIIEMVTPNNGKMRAYVFEDCIKLANNTETVDKKKSRIRWYKNGKLKR
jgi:hypothetical protein